jgi:hypothetical protein
MLGHLLASVLPICGSLIASELSNGSTDGGGFRLLLKSERYPAYAIQSSSNLIEWNTVQLSFGPATNRPLEFESLSAPRTFFRAARVDTPTFGYALVAKETILAEASLFDSFDFAWLSRASLISQDAIEPEGDISPKCWQAGHCRKPGERPQR